MDINNEELLEISIKLERDGKRFYTELAKAVQDPILKDFLKLIFQELMQNRNGRNLIQDYKF